MRNDDRSACLWTINRFTRHLISAVFCLGIPGATARGQAPEPTTRPARRPPPAPVPRDEDETQPLTTLRKLTEKEIWRIRFLELRGTRQGPKAQPESITVRIDKKQVDEFLTLLEGAPKPWMPEDADYTNEQARAEFRKMTAAQKAHYIAADRGSEFADKIHITSDPEVFVEFRKHVMPIILRGCATAGCHGPTGGDEAKFRLFQDPKKAAETTYANFIILNDLQVNGLPLLNRSQPANSLLLSYMLPTKDIRPDSRHPGGVDYRPLFQNRNSADFKRVENWIGSLKHPAEEYAIHLLPTPARPTASEPAREGQPQP